MRCEIKLYHNNLLVFIKVYIKIIWLNIIEYKFLRIFFYDIELIFLQKLGNIFSMSLWPLQSLKIGVEEEFGFDRVLEDRVYILMIQYNLLMII